MFDEMLRGAHSNRRNDGLATYWYGYGTTIQRLQLSDNTQCEGGRF